MTELPIPPFFDPKSVGQLRFVDYPTIMAEAVKWAKKYTLKPVSMDKVRVGVVPIDVQNTFMMPGGGLPVEGALEACARACAWCYRNLNVISKYIPTMDTHTTWQIFHPPFILENDEFAGPGTMTSVEDVRSGKRQINPAAAAVLLPNNPGGYTYLRQYLEHYTKKLKEGGKYNLTTWPFHAEMGGIEHALNPLLHEAIFFHEIARSAQRQIGIKGGKPLTENYSPLSPEVTIDHLGNPFGQKNTEVIESLMNLDVIVAWGFASSHCFASFVDDLLKEIMAADPKLVKKVYLLKDCTAPVIIRDGNGKVIVDFTPQAEAAFKRFADAGMHVVNSTTPMNDWPDIKI